MEKKFAGVNPAPHSLSSIPESDSILILETLLDKTRVKAFLKKDDKTPNIDGSIEIVTPEQYPVGKLEVQVKTLDKRNAKKPKFQCSKSFLVYCSTSILPVLLIVVDRVNKKAYWQHVNQVVIGTAKDDTRKKSVNIDIPIENTISATNRYINEWLAIVRDYSDRVIYYPSIKKELNRKNKQYKNLREIADPILGTEKEIFKELHIFLDYYNDLLNRDFSVIKNVYYRKYWKIGIAYSKYSNDQAVYALFPISYTQNDTQIKKLRLSKTNKNIEFLSVEYHSSNPIKENPLRLTYKYIGEDLKEIIDKRLILQIDISLAREYIISFIDNYYKILGLSANRKEYSIDKVIESLVNVSVFFEHLNGLHRKKSKYNRLINIDYFMETFIHEEINIKAALEKIKAKKEPRNKYFILSREYNINYLNRLLTFLKNLKFTTVERLYPVKRIPKRETYYRWEIYKTEDYKKLLTAIMDNLPATYDNFISQYFPLIKDKLSFFNDFNWMIININIPKTAMGTGSEPEIEIIYLKNVTDPHKNEISIYELNTEPSPVNSSNRREVYNNGLHFKNHKFKLVRSNNGFLDDIFSDTPLQHYLYKFLKMRLEEYLKSIYEDIRL